MSDDDCYMSLFVLQFVLIFHLLLIFLSHCDLQLLLVFNFDCAITGLTKAYRFDPIKDTFVLVRSFEQLDMRAARVAYDSSTSSYKVCDNKPV